MAIVSEENCCLFEFLVELHSIPSVAPICKSFWSLLAIFCLFIPLALVLPKSLAKQQLLQDVNSYGTLLVNPGLLAAFLNLFMHQNDGNNYMYILHVCFQTYATRTVGRPALVSNFYKKAV